MKDELRQNLESRKELLGVLFKRFIECLDVIEPDNAIEFSQPLTDALLIAVGQLQDYGEMKKVDAIINDILSKDA